MKNRQSQAAGIVFTLLTTLIPLTAQAGGSSYSITETNPQIRTLEAGKNNQLVKELEVSLYNEAFPSINDMKFNVSCNSGEGLKKVSVGQGTKTLGSSDFSIPQSFASGTTVTHSPANAEVKATGSEIKNGTDEKFWVKFDVADSDKTSAHVCEFSSFNFKNGPTGGYLDSFGLYESVAKEITPIVIVGSTKGGPIKSSLEVDMKKLGDLTYKLGSQNQLIYMADVTANQDLTIDDIIFSCQNSYSLKKLTLKDQTAKKILSETEATENDTPLTPDYFPPVQSAFFTDLDWQIRGGSTRQLNISADFITTGWSSEYKHGCSIMAINAHIIDPNNTSKNISIHPTQIPGIGLKYQTSPLTISFDFLDIEKGDELYNATTYLREAYIIDGYEDGMFHPLNKINRAEFAQMIAKAQTKGFLSGYDVNCSKEKEPDFFSDVAKDIWYNLPICYLYHGKTIKGYADGTFKPEKNISRAEAIKMALKVSGTQIDPEPTNAPWYTPYIKPAQERGMLTKDYHLARPNEEITRGEMATILYNALHQAPFKPTPELTAKLQTLENLTEVESANKTLQSAAQSPFLPKTHFLC